MYDYQIEDIVEKDRKTHAIFGGVYSKNEVFSVPMRRNKLFICNQSYSTEEGTHWILAGKLNNRIIFADPLAQDYRRFGNKFTAWLREPHLPIVTLAHRVQAHNSNFCGAFCIMFMWLLARNYSISQIARLFSGNPHKNDQIVQRFLLKKNESEHCQTDSAKWILNVIACFSTLQTWLTLKLCGTWTHPAM